ncbi:MAG: serpin family protein [Candidatus Zixiibacteriota bacterium]|nr:MAG: serpin family protein [candidate division Zixibacteria bacterium]
MKKRFGLLLILALAFLLVQCSDRTVEPEPVNDSPVRTPDNLNAAEQELAGSFNRFGLKLFREIVDQEPGDINLFLSPVSVSMALGMTCNGARGQTRDEMQTTLEIAGLTPEEMNHAYHSLIQLLVTLDDDVKLTIANSIWSRTGLPVKDEFIELNRTYFDALVRTLDFSDSTAADTINAWVYENTGGKIEKIISGPISPDVVMHLINAIYFKAAWTIPFNPDSTLDAGFNLPDGSTTACRMMNKEGYFHIRLTPDFYAVDLPYGDSSFSMLVILPHQEIGIDSVVRQMTEENWIAWTDPFVIHNIPLSLPRFKVEYEIQLKPILESMGMPLSFTPAADFTGMVEGGGLWIDAVKHKTYVEINEEGTEAAAVTDVIMVTSMPPPFVADRPFLFVIYERVNKTILFMGRIVKPSTD